jgi:hypothetical protein
MLDLLYKALCIPDITYITIETGVKATDEVMQRE